MNIAHFQGMTFNPPRVINRQSQPLFSALPDALKTLLEKTKDSYQQADELLIQEIKKDLNDFVKLSKGYSENSAGNGNWSTYLNNHVLILIGKIEKIASKEILGDVIDVFDNHDEYNQIDDRLKRHLHFALVQKTSELYHPPIERELFMEA